MTPPGALSLPVAEPGLDPVPLSPGSRVFSTKLCSPRICQESTVYQVPTVEKTHRVLAHEQPLFQWEGWSKNNSTYACS